MSPIATLLKGFRLASKLDPLSMSAKLGTTVDRLRLVESGGAFPTVRERRLWAGRLGFADLLEFDNLWRDSWTRLTRAHRDGWVAIVNKAPAGPPVDYHEYGIDTGIGYDYVPRPAGFDDEVLFAVVIVGDSMLPVYRDGDLVVFRPLNPAETVPDGSPVFVRFTAGRDHGCTIKSVYRRADGLLDLRPENTNHPAMTIDPADVDRMSLAVERRPNFYLRPRHTQAVRDEWAQDFYDD